MDSGCTSVLVQALDLDDFSNSCDCESHPLLKTINRELRGLAAGPDCGLTGNYAAGRSGEVSPSPGPDCAGGSLGPVPGDCGKFRVCAGGQVQERGCPAGLHWARDRCDWPAAADCYQPAQSEQSKVTNVLSSTVEELAPISRKKVICYYTNWAFYRQGAGRFTPQEIEPGLCTHINYGFAVLDPVRLVMVPHDDWADVEKNFLGQVAALRRRGVRVSVALGGWNDSEGDKYSRLVGSADSREKFVGAAVEFLRDWGLEGLSLDWEYPVCWQVDCRAGPAQDREGFTALLAELAAVFRPRGWTLSAAVSPSKAVMDNAYDIPAIIPHLDIINIMAYGNIYCIETFCYLLVLLRLPRPLGGPHWPRGSAVLTSRRRLAGLQRELHS